MCGHYFDVLIYSRSLLGGHTISVSFAGNNRKSGKICFSGGYSFNLFPQNTPLIHALTHIYGQI